MFRCKKSAKEETIRVYKASAVQFAAKDFASKVPHGSSNGFVIRAVDNFSRRNGERDEPRYTQLMRRAT